MVKYVVNLQEITETFIIIDLRKKKKTQFKSIITKKLFGSLQKV